MNNLKKLAKKQARKVGMTLLVFILLIGALATPIQMPYWQLLMATTKD